MNELKSQSTHHLRPQHASAIQSGGANEPDQREVKKGRVRTMRSSRAIQVAISAVAAVATLFAAVPSVADEAPDDIEAAEPGTTFEFDELEIQPEATASGYDSTVHGANTLRGATWATPKVGPETQTKTGPTWPKYKEKGDDPAYYGWGCHVNAKASTEPIGCVVNSQGSTKVVVVGSSYVGQWMPAILDVAKKEDWAVTIHTKTWCDFQPGRKITDPNPYPECDTFNNKVLAKMKADVPDIIITSHYDSSMTSHMTGVYKDLANRGVDDIVGIWNTNGAFAEEGPGLNKGAWCVRDTQAGVKSEYNNYTIDFRECTYALGDFNKQGNKAMRQLDANLSDFHYVSLQDWFCPKDSSVAPRCPSVIGQVVPWRDGAHVTNEWTASFTNVLHEALYRDGVTSTRPGTDAVSRVAGPTRYDTSAAISASVGTGRTVYVTTGADFPDALTAGAKAGEINSAVLLTRPDHLPASVSNRLKALKPTRVVVVGSTKAINNTVLNKIKSVTGAKVTRVGGANRYQTAANLATMSGFKTGGTVYVANGLDFPDALTTSAVAGAGPQSSGGSAVLLTKPSAVPQDTRAALTKLKPSSIVVIGGPQAVSGATMSTLSKYTNGETTRIAGANRYETAAKLAANTDPGRTVYVSVGTEFADAGSVAPIAAAEGSLLLVKSNAIPQATRNALAKAKPSKIVVVGGTKAINSTVQKDLAQYIH